MRSPLLFLSTDDRQPSTVFFPYRPYHPYHPYRPYRP